MESTESKRLTPAEQTRAEVEPIVAALLALYEWTGNAGRAEELEPLLMAAFGAIDRLTPVFERAQAGDDPTAYVEKGLALAEAQKKVLRERAERAEAAADFARAEVTKWSNRCHAAEADVARLREALSSVVAGWPTMQALAIARRTLDALAATEPKRDE